MILDRLDGARRKLRGNRLLVGVLTITASFVAVAASFFIIDWLAINRILPLGTGDLIARIILLVIAAVVLVRIIWLEFIAEWRIQRDDDTMALAVEVRHRELGGRLISTVQLSRAPDERGHVLTSSDLISGLIEQTEEISSSLDFFAIIDYRALKRSALIALCALLVAGGLSAWRPAHAKALLARLALMQVDYPTASTITAVRHTGLIAKGDSYPIEIELDAQRFIPESAEAQIRFATGGTITVSLRRVADDSTGKARFRGQVTQALDDFTFKPIAADARWPRWEQVSTLHRPALGNLVVACTYPAYLKMPPTTSALGDIQVPEGTVVTFSCAVTKAVTQAQLILRQGDADAVTTPAVISGAEKNAVSGSFTVSGSGSWALQIEDVDGLAPTLPPSFTISAVPDRSPVLTILTPNRDKLAAPRAKWPIRFTVKDEYGLTTARLQYTIEGTSAGAEGETPPVSVELPGFALPGETALSKSLEFDLGRLNLQPGMRVTWWLEVSDNRNPVANIGVSQRLHFTIVEPTTLRDEADRLNQEHLDSTLHIRDQQKTGRDEVQRLLKSVDTK